MKSTKDQIVQDISIGITILIGIAGFVTGQMVSGYVIFKIWQYIPFYTPGSFFGIAVLLVSSVVGITTGLVAYHLAEEPIRKTTQSTIDTITR